MYGDTDKMNQILTNLLTNAVKYTEVGGVTFSVSMLERENSICKVQYSVKDTGRGLTAEESENLFVVYERLDESSETEKTGTGLGIDISRKFAELMGGEETRMDLQGMTELMKNSLTLLSCLPLWILYPFIQKYLVKGVMIGSVKG